MVHATDATEIARHIECGHSQIVYWESAIEFREIIDILVQTTQW